MENSPKYDSIQPRFLRYRNHYKLYGLSIWFTAIITFSYWGFQLIHFSWWKIWMEQKSEFIISNSLLAVLFAVYFFWLRPHIKKAIQVFSDHLLLHESSGTTHLSFQDVESVSVVCWSLFYLKMKSGKKYYFNSNLDRLDYIWQGLRAARPDLLSEAEFESFHLKLVQYDHHQKRKEWFFRHKLIDAFNWIVLPVVLILIGYTFQSKDVVIHQHGMYFFRLLMFTLLILLMTSFIFSMILKKFVFDKKIATQLSSGEKVRNLEFEGVILHRSKIFQMGFSTFFFALMIHSHLNFYSVTKLKDQVADFNLKKGATVLVDNRYNCSHCAYQINDGDVIVFGRGYFGQVLAKQGEFVGEVSQDQTGRSIASENIQEVPAGHVAVRASNGKDIVFVKWSQITGKIRK